MLTIVATLQDARAMALDEDRGCAWITQADGSVLSVDLGTGTSTPQQTLVPPATGIAVGGTVGVLADTDGTIASFDPDSPATAGPAIATVYGRPGQVGLTAKRGSALVVSGRTRPNAMHPTKRAALAVVDLGDGSVKRVAVEGVTGVSVAGRAIYVAGTDTGTGKGYVAILRGWATQPLAFGLPRAGQLGTAEAGDVLLIAHPAIGALTAVRPATAAVDTVSTSGVPGRLVVAQGLSDGRIAVLTADALAIVDALSDLSVDPWIEPLDHALFVASWSALSFSLGNTGLTPADVHFSVPDGPEAGIISAATLEGIGDPVPLLIAGGRVGSHQLDLVETATSTVLASTKFEVTDHWDDEDTGPSGTYVGASSFDGASGWGGGPGTPQNVGVRPHVGDWRSLVLMVDTTTDRWPTATADMTANRTAVLAHVSTGANFNGVNRSARQYYEENSRYVAPSGGNPARGLTLTTRNNQAFGPVNLPGSWTDYFAQKKDKDGVVIDDRWSSKGGTVQTIISRALSDGICTTADFTAVDVLIIIPRSPDAVSSAGARFVWPHAHDPVSFLAGMNPTTDMRNLAYAFGPLDFAVHDGRQLHSTLSHELGHTLGLPDLYDFPVYGPDVTSRLTGGWDMMAGSRDTLPHYTLSNKMRMNWVPSGQLKLFNFQGSGAVDQNITLHAAELGDAPAGQFRGIEIRLADGWNYYVEYRAEQAGFASDDLITDRTVVITDVTSDAFVAPVARPNIVFVRKDIDGDGPLLNVSADLEEKDPGTQMDLIVDVVSTAADNAVVRVRYGANGKPEPGIRPWDGGPTWQSPDIEIRNDRATADPGKWFNVPWLGHDNTVVAKVKNSGDLLAKGVVVDFFVTEYSSGDGPWIPLGNVSHDIAANTTEEFAVGWAPDAADGKHYCIIVRIRLYQDPGNLAIVDNNIYNNEARSNYTKFISASSSPSSRVGTDVLLANPFDDSTHVYAVVKQTHPQHRVFIEHQWLRVDGHGQRPVKVWDEALYGTPEWDVVQREGHQEAPSYLWEIPNQVSVAGWATRPFETDCGAQTLTGGVGLRIDAGRATRVEILERSYNYVMGFVEFVDDKTPVTNGLVLIEVTAAPGKYFTVTTDVHADGRFGTDYNNPFGEDTATVEAHFLGTYSAAPSTSGPVPIR